MLEMLVLVMIMNFMMMVSIVTSGVANIKVYHETKELLTLATQLFLGKSEDEIKVRIKDTVEALQRSTIAQLTGWLIA